MRRSFVPCCPGRYSLTLLTRFTDLFDLSRSGHGTLPADLGRTVEAFGRNALPARDAVYPRARFSRLATYLGLGAAFSGLDFHEHRAVSSCAVQIFGRKLWLMAPPNCSRAQLAGAYPPHALVYTSGAPRPSGAAGGGALQSGCPIQWCIQLPADVVHVPRRWWHATWNLDVAVSVATQVVVE